MDDFVPIGSQDYFFYLTLLFFARSMDFLSTWIATPNLSLEANPIAKKLGWKWGGLVNLIVVVIFACWPVPAIVIITTSLLVAARNFQSAWLMRSMGENGYRNLIAEQLGQIPLPLYIFCLIGQTILVALLGLALMYTTYNFIGDTVAPFAIGMGILTYAVAVTAYTLLAVWRMRRRLS